MNDYIAYLRTRRVAIVGAGISNLPLLKLLVTEGVDVSVRDKAPIELDAPRSVIGDGYLDCSGEDVVFRSPGVRPWELTLSPGATLTSEMEAFFELCPCPIIAVTGSDGKTTTTTLIAELLRADGLTVHLGGNLGRPLLTEIPNMRKSDYAVVELSSFQLMTMRRSPHIAVITNVSPNHLDWHRSYDEYVAAKCNIFLWQRPGDRLIYGNAAVQSGVQPAKMLGEHNRVNFATAVEATRGLVSDSAIQSVAECFVGVEHRLEPVRELRGV
ncbi:MAG: UDP-N-acetylmuramoyl-L-alanine--D-glutamate ligase, partial [Oscillospiraceae bacterium]|nr:UDP-N-acetylmuramoyl-L-alanine--D-glutamate ligase [Oscillospiraceae bacterium]